MGDIKTGESMIELTPGIYRAISEDVKENNGALGDIEILIPGDEVELVINYENKTATIKSPEKQINK